MSVAFSSRWRHDYRVTASKPADLTEQERRFRRRLGERIRALRLESGLNQDELAHRAGLHRSHIGLVENGLRDPQLATIYRLAVAFRLTPAQLLDIPLESSGEESASSLA